MLLEDSHLKGQERDVRLTLKCILVKMGSEENWIRIMSNGGL
jgi:hypothetical protein